MKSAFVALIGRPSSGKSTLLNRICGEKISIISTVPQTTRNKIRGIANRDQGQLVFIDTPGYHNSEKKISRYLRNLTLSSIDEADIILYLIDITRPLGEEERELMSLLAPLKDRLIIALNKSDLPGRNREIINAEIGEYFPDLESAVISAFTGEGVEEMLERIFELSPEGEKLYPDDIYTDQEPEFRIAEVVREKAIQKTRQELPHALYVEIADMEMQENSLWIRGFIYVERESQKGILVGKGGCRIKEIRSEAEQELKDIFPYKVKLDIRVKVKPKWRKQDALIKKLIR